MDTFNAPMAGFGPTVEDLAAIEAEWPLIEAELTLLDAEIRMIAADGDPTELDWRRVRRATSRVLREATALTARPADPSRAA
jgi:hypothetical protein